MKCEGCDHYVSGRAEYCRCGKKTPPKLERIKIEERFWMYPRKFKNQNYTNLQLNRYVYVNERYG